VLRPFFAEKPVGEVIEHIRLFVKEGLFPRDFGRVS